MSQGERPRAGERAGVRGKYFELALGGLHLPPTATGPAFLEALRPEALAIAPIRRTPHAPIVWTAELRFPRWTAGDPATLPWSLVYGKKRNIVGGAQGRLSFAEAEVVSRLRGDGWNAGWIDSFGRAPQEWAAWTADLDNVPVEVGDMLHAITYQAAEAAGRHASRAGIPDIVAWRPGETAFIELKGAGDRVSDEQEAWARAAVALDPDRYALVNWRHRA